jgi:glycosyltransferase involved in cell wall biosynthesis
MAPDGANVAAVVHNPIDVDAWPVGLQKQDFLLWLGRIVPEKGPQRAIRVAKASNRPLVLAGPWPVRILSASGLRPNWGPGVLRRTLERRSLTDEGRLAAQGPLGDETDRRPSASAPFDGQGLSLSETEGAGRAVDAVFVAHRGRRRVAESGPVEIGAPCVGGAWSSTLQHAASVAALLLTTAAVVAEELMAQPGAIVAPGFGDPAEGPARPSSPV